MLQAIKIFALICSIIFRPSFTKPVKTHLIGHSSLKTIPKVWGKSTKRCGPCLDVGMTEDGQQNIYGVGGRSGKMPVVEMMQKGVGET